MPYKVPIEIVKAQFPDYNIIKELTPSEQKDAFYVQSKEKEDLCLKMVSPDYSIDRLHREIAAMLTVSHPNVVRFREYTFSVKRDQQKHYIIEDYIEGTDMSACLGPNKMWGRKEAKAFFSQLCAGLEAIHSNGIVHRDLKPSNIRVKTNNAPVIIDLGTARHLRLPALTRTADGARIGTPVYFAPEQWIGDKHDIDLRTDLFAVGIMLFYSLTGEHPFYKQSMTTEEELRQAICEGSSYLSCPAFVELPKGWQLLIKKLLSKSKEQRPNNASVVMAIIGKLED